MPISVGGSRSCSSGTLDTANLFSAEMLQWQVKVRMVTKIFPRTKGVILSKAIVARLLGGVPRMSLVSLELVIMEAKRIGWICMLVVSRKMPTNLVLERRFPQSVSARWVMNLSSLLLVSLWMSLDVVMQLLALLET